MGHYIIKLTDEGKKDYYLEYSSVCDAPITYGMDLDEFKEYYQEEYGKSGMEGLPQRLARVEAVGTSEYSAKSVDETLVCNRAGKNETRLTKAQIVEMYCVHPEVEIEGESWRDIIAAQEAEEKQHGNPV